MKLRGPINSARIARIVAGTLLAGSALLLGSCNIVAAAGYIVHGPEKIPAKYQLDPKQTTVVFIDDASYSVLPSRAVRRKIGETAEGVLLNEVKIEKVVSSQDVMTIVDREKYSKAMTVPEVGEAVGADVIVIASMISYSLFQDQENYTPIATCSVRVVDVKEKKQLWPLEMDKSFVLEIKSPPRTGVPTGTVDRNKLQVAFAERIGREIGHIFIAHTEQPEAGLLDH